MTRASPTPEPAPLGPPPTPDDVRGILAGVLDPELNVGIVDLGMVKEIDVAPNGDVRVKVALTTAACPLRGQIATDVKSKIAGLAGVGVVHVDYGEMTQEERSTLMQRARKEAQLRAPATEVAPTTRVIAVGQRQGRGGQVLGDREPRRRARGAWPHGRCARRRHLGLLDPPHARRPRSSRRHEGR